MTITLSTSSIGPAFAAGGKIILANCGDVGCECSLLAITVSDFAVLTDTTPPKDAEEMTLIKYKGEYSWSSVLRDQLDLAMGGDGICEIKLFDDIVPLNGMWVGSIRVQSIEGCLLQVAEMVPPLVDGMKSGRNIS